MNSVARPRGPAVHLIPLSSQIGEFIRISDLDDPQVSENISTLHEQGIFGARISKLPTARMARAVIPGVPGGTADEVSFQAMVFCCDTIEEGTPSEWMHGLLDGTDASSLPAIFVGGNRCTNFAVGFDVARGLIASRQADSVLVVTSDRVLSGTRHLPSSMTVFSDGAMACLVTCDPEGRPSYELIGAASEKWTSSGSEREWLADARVTLSAMRSATQRITGGENGRFRHLVTPNFGKATRKMLAMAVGMPPEKLYAGPVTTIGHCFSADIPMNMKHLDESSFIAEGDEIITVCSSRSLLSVVAFVYRTGSP